MADDEEWSPEDFEKELDGVLGELDHFEVLGLQTNASKENVRKAYFVLAKRLHPEYGIPPGVRPKLEKA